MSRVRSFRYSRDPGSQDRARRMLEAMRHPYANLAPRPSAPSGDDEEEVDLGSIDDIAREVAAAEGKV